MKKNIETNERVELLSKMIGTDPKFWPFPIPKNFQVHLLDVEIGYIKFKVTVQEEWLNPLKILHGGVMMTLMDDAMGMAVYSLHQDNRFATINMNTEFFKSSRTGDTIFISARIEKPGKQVIHAVSHIENDAGLTLAKSSSNLVVFNKKT